MVLRENRGRPLARIAAERLGSALWQREFPRAELPPLRNEGFGQVSIALSRDGTLLATGGWTGDLRIWKTADGEPLRTIETDSIVIGMAFSPNSRLVATGGAKGVQVWDLLSGERVGKPIAHARGVLAVEFSPDGKSLLVGSDDGKAAIWEIESLAEDFPRRVPLFGQHGCVVAGQFDPTGGRVVVAGTSGKAHVYDAASGGLLYAVAHDPGDGGVVRQLQPGWDAPADGERGRDGADLGCRLRAGARSADAPRGAGALRGV